MASFRTSSTLSILASRFNPPSTSNLGLSSSILHPSRLDSTSPVRYLSSFSNPDVFSSNATSIAIIPRNNNAVTSLQLKSSLFSTRHLSSSSPSSTFNSTILSRFQSTSTLTRKDSPSPSPSTQPQPQPQPESSEPEPESDEPPPKASFRERMRFLSRRYGWWALAVYLLASFIDFSLIFAAIHFLGAEHIKEWENWVREKVGLEKLKHKIQSSDDGNLEDSTISISIPTLGGNGKELELVNNSKAAKEALELRKGSLLTSNLETSNPNSDSNHQTSSEKKRNGGGGGAGASTLWTEAVLAYTIHKTLLLPFRVMFTAAVLPSFVKLMVKWGLSKPNYVVKNAAKKAHEKAARRKMAT